MPKHRASLPLPSPYRPRSYWCVPTQRSLAISTVFLPHLGQSQANPVHKHGSHISIFALHSSPEGFFHDEMTEFAASRGDRRYTGIYKHIYLIAFLAWNNPSRCSYNPDASKVHQQFLDSRTSLSKEFTFETGSKPKPSRYLTNSKPPSMWVKVHPLCPGE